MNGEDRPVNLEIGALFSQAWGVFSKNLGTLLLASVILYVIFGVLAYFTRSIGNFIVGGPLCYGYCVLALRLVRGESGELSVIFSGFQRFLPTFLASLLISVFLAVGFSLCVLPGFFVMIIYLLTFFYMADSDAGAWASMEASRTTVMKNFLSWSIIWLFLVLLNLAGMLVVGIGTLVTMPLSVLVLAAAYDQVASSSELRAE
ncbi:MAG TPA: hypothetical protein PKY35_06840 [Candidatus Hydrogenedentes bacterium]|nr:hypothetical protein [Candidatus Hydrogenedentota bacterium]HOL76730.1 hypothetical protein [Candidatus Hydrogenedentota bacterium]HPO85309.1 hypothetical protein [Candidatus Hydrogenedentota bacterium]